MLERSRRSSRRSGCRGPLSWPRSERRCGARIGRAYLRDALLRPRPGREPDQIAQGPARFRLPHTAAYWLILTVQDTIPKVHALATAEFNTIRLRLLKLGARVVEMASRVRLAFAAACPEAA